MRLIYKRDSVERALAFWGLFTVSVLYCAYLTLPVREVGALTLVDCSSFAWAALLSMSVALVSPARYEITVDQTPRTWAVRRRQLLGLTRISEYGAGFIRQVNLKSSASEGDACWVDFLTQWGETFPLTDFPVEVAQALRVVEAFTEPLGLSYQNVQMG